MNGRFVNGDKSSVPANALEKVLDVVLPPSLSGKYSVEKGSTHEHPTTWTDPENPNRVYEIKWVNNFKLKQKPGAKIKPNAPMEYEIQFEKPDLGNVTYTKLFYYLNNKIQPFEGSDYDEIVGGKIAARLRIDDPGIGWGGGT
jgi:hypothetical protein